MQRFPSIPHYWLGFIIAAGVFSRYIEVGGIVYISLVGSILVVLSAMQAFMPSLNVMLGTIIALVLTVAGIFYQIRQIKSPPIASR